MKFLAKDNGITLKEHTINVIKQVEQILFNAGIVDETIINLGKIAAAVHDCGKTSYYFQAFLNGSGDDNFPRHNEIGCELIDFIVDKEYGIYKNNISDLIKYVTLYHHKPFNRKGMFNELFNDNNEINKISKYYNDIFKECGIDNIIRFKENISEDEFEDCGYIVGAKNTFDFIRIDNIKDSKDKLTVFEIIFNAVRYADFIVSKNYEFNPSRKNHNFTNLNLIMPSHFDKKRWDEQCNVADKAFEKNVSIISATMGWGKTICGANFLLHSNKRGFWICPDNALAISTYNNLVNTLKECGANEIKVSLLLSGAWKKCNWEHNNNNININDADIIVTNIDTCVNGITRNSRKEISFEALFSNCIFDEYHEYAFTNTPLLPLFLSIINARKKMNNIKTLLLSGTAINKGYVNVDKDAVIEAGEYIEKEKKVNIKYITADDYYKNYINTPNSVHINTRIKTCQNSYDIGDMDFCYHSLFDDNDSINIINNIIAHNGKNAKLNPSTVSSTSVFSRGMDVSFGNAFLINPTPEQIEQITGRSGRWDFSIIGNIFIVLDNRKTELFIYQETNAWDKYYNKYIQHLQSKIDENSISIFDLKNIRINFFENNVDKKISYKKLVDNNVVKGLELLSKIIFTDGSYINMGESNDKHIKDSTDVRGDIVSRFFAIQITGEPFGVLSGPINIPYYRFGNEEFSNLNNYEIINNIRHYFSNNNDIAEKYGIKNLKQWKDRNLFNYLIKKAKCSETPFPILCNYEYTRKKGFL